MEDINNIFGKLNINNEKQDLIKHKLLEIVRCYLYGNELCFDTFDDDSKNFIEKHGEKIVVKEIKKYSEYVNINDVKDIIYYCLE